MGICRSRVLQWATRLCDGKEGGWEETIRHPESINRLSGRGIQVIIEENNVGNPIICLNIDVTSWKLKTTYLISWFPALSVMPQQASRHPRNKE